jgi:ParB-like chromosome segregation protein Spo0J
MAVKKVMKIHPLCRLFGQVAPLSKDEKANMFESVKKNGIKVPILLNKKKDTILDGKTRWDMAFDAKLKLTDDNFEVFPSEDEEKIKEEIVIRNLDRRHMSDDQRTAIVSKLFGPQLEKEAKERQSKAGSFKGAAKLDGKGSVAQQIAKTAGVSQHKAQQAEKARKAGALDDVIQGKSKLRGAAKKGTTKKREKKTVSFEDQVYKKWTQWLNRFAPPARREVCKWVKGWIG